MNSMDSDDTLKIKNLPEEFSIADKEEFCRYFGAIKVKVISSRMRQRTVVYAKFDTKERARAVLYRLHQTYVLKNRLCVEYSEKDVGLHKIKHFEDKNLKSKDIINKFINDLNSFNHSVGFYQPPPPTLKYSYPKANRMTINNIGHALASVPKFYVQVLHLMNRMNFPPPFAVEPQNLAFVENQSKNKTISETESELESDNEAAKSESHIIPKKRKLPIKKLIKRPKFIKPVAVGQSNKPATVTSSSNIEVFEKVNVQEKKKIELKVSDNFDDNISTDCNITQSICGKESEEELKSAFISDSELKANQIPANNLDILPVFKKYFCGTPTSRLYIKNIAKTVELKDLEYIYNRYKTNVTGEQSKFNIKLMHEGRMKGQAFITLDSTEIAEKALKETNAFILKDKPLVVVFAKSVPKKK